jgi:hypothetical protein
MTTELLLGVVGCLVLARAGHASNRAARPVLLQQLPTYRMLTIRS